MDFPLKLINSNAYIQKINTKMIYVYCMYDIRNGTACDHDLSLKKKAWLEPADLLSVLYQCSIIQNRSLTFKSLTRKVDIEYNNIV